MVKASNLREAIIEALDVLGGSGSISEVKTFINTKYSNKWKDIGTAMADLYPESTSSLYPQSQRPLERIGRGKYRLRKLKSTRKYSPTKPRIIKDSKKATNIEKYSFRSAQEVLEKKGQLSTILKAASLIDLSSKSDHEKVQRFLHENKWDIEVSIFPVFGYRLDAFKEKTGIEIERSLIDAIHRSLFR